MVHRKSKGILFLLILCGIVLGGFIGNYLTKSFSSLSWLNYGQTFGFKNPVTLNLGIIIMTFGITIKISVAGILGVLIAIFIYKKL